MFQRTCFGWCTINSNPASAKMNWCTHLIRADELLLELSASCTWKKWTVSYRYRLSTRSLMIARSSNRQPHSARANVILRGLTLLSSQRLHSNGRASYQNNGSCLIFGSSLLPSMPAKSVEFNPGNSGNSGRRNLTNSCSNLAKPGANVSSGACVNIHGW